MMSNSLPSVARQPIPSVQLGGPRQIVHGGISWALKGLDAVTIHSNAAYNVPYPFILE